MSDVTIRAEGLSKRYRIGESERDATLVETLGRALRSPLRFRRRPARVVWAVRDVSFEVCRGEVVGIIGRNGAGKSTLLKILSRITEPTEASFDEIVAFAEVGAFLDTPVKHYSSGMYLRLAFAVAAHLEPEILLVDEVLAVGDAAFQRKCLGKMGDVASAGKTVLLVSHNMGAIQSLCGRALLISRGELSAQGPTEDVVRTYLGEFSASDALEVDLAGHPDRLPRMRSVLRRVSLLNGRGEAARSFLMGEPIVLRLGYDASAEAEPVAGAGFILSSSSGVRIGGFNTYMGSKPPHRLPRSGIVEFEIVAPILTPGRYSVTVSLGTHPSALCDKIESAIDFEVVPVDVYDTGYLLTPADGVVALHCRVRDFSEARTDRQ